MTIEQRLAVLEDIFARLQDYYTSAYSGEEIDARLASAGVPVGITKEYKSVAEMNQDFTGTDVQRGQFVLILPDSTASADYGKVYLKGTANWVYAFIRATAALTDTPQRPHRALQERPRHLWAKLPGSTGETALTPSAWPPTAPSC